MDGMGWDETDRIGIFRTQDSQDEKQLDRTDWCLPLNVLCSIQNSERDSICTAKTFQHHHHQQQQSRR